MLVCGWYAHTDLLGEGDHAVGKLAQDLGTRHRGDYAIVLDQLINHGAVWVCGRVLSAASCNTRTAACAIGVLGPCQAS